MCVVHGYTAFRRHAISGNYTILDYAETIIGKNCFIGPNVGLYTTYHHLNPEERYKTGRTKPIKIGNNVWIGRHSCILASVTIRDGAVIGAGSIVKYDVKPYTVVTGNPAKFIKSLKC